MSSKPPSKQKLLDHSDLSIAASYFPEVIMGFDTVRTSAAWRENYVPTVYWPGLCEFIILDIFTAETCGSSRSTCFSVLGKGTDRAATHVLKEILCQIDLS